MRNRGRVDAAGEGEGGVSRPQRGGEGAGTFGRVGVPPPGFCVGDGADNSGCCEREGAEQLKHFYLRWGQLIVVGRGSLIFERRLGHS